MNINSAYKAREFKNSDLDEITEWWNHKIPFYEEPSKKWADWALSNGNVHVYCLEEGKTILSVMQIDVENEIGYVGIVTNPLYKRNGYAKDLASQAEELLPENVCFLEASIEHENSSSILLFKQLGYTFIRQDKDFQYFRKCIAKR